MSNERRGADALGSWESVVASGVSAPTGRPSLAGGFQPPEGEVISPLPALKGRPSLAGGLQPPEGEVIPPLLSCPEGATRALFLDGIGAEDLDRRRQQRDARQEADLIGRRSQVQGISGNEDPTHHGHAGENRRQRAFDHR